MDTSESQRDATDSTSESETQRRRGNATSDEDETNGGNLESGNGQDGHERSFSGSLFVDNGMLFGRKSRDNGDDTDSATNSPSSLEMEEGNLEKPGEKKERLRSAPPKLIRQDGVRNVTDRVHYRWAKFLRAHTINDVFHWMVYGFSPNLKKSDEEVMEDLTKLARLLRMLRDYYQRFGLPEEGGPKDQEYVLREVTRALYASGCPVWALENTMERCSEGLTGSQGVDFFILPKKVSSQFLPEPCAVRVDPASQTYAPSNAR